MPRRLFAPPALLQRPLLSAGSSFHPPSAHHCFIPSLRSFLSLSISSCVREWHPPLYILSLHPRVLVVRSLFYTDAFQQRKPLGSPRPHHLHCRAISSTFISTQSQPIWYHRDRSVRKNDRRSTRPTGSVAISKDNREYRENCDYSQSKDLRSSTASFENTSIPGLDFRQPPSTVIRHSTQNP